jgi:hypothetical protein
MTTKKSYFGYGVAKVAPRRWQVFCWKWGKSGHRLVGRTFDRQGDAAQWAASYQSRQRDKGRNVAGN